MCTDGASKEKVMGPLLPVSGLVPDVCFNAGIIGKAGMPPLQLPGTINGIARFKAYAAEMRVSKGAGLGMGETCAAARKKASWRASMARMEAGPGTRVGSVRAREEATLMTAPIPTLVMMFAKEKNSSGVVTGNMYSHGVKVLFLKWRRMFSAVWTWISSWAWTLVTI